MKVLVALTYYRPHTSGLTIYAERLARGLAARGHEVTVLTSQFDPTTPRDETRDGVHIVRAPVVLRVSKGVLMPTFGALATRLARAHDVLSLHLPQFDAPGLALRGRLFGKPTTLTYHCDLFLPAGALNRLANRIVDVANRVAGSLATRIVAYTEDYASHSPFLQRYPDKIDIIPPPVDLPEGGPDLEERARELRGGGAGPVIGMAARLAAEKGAEILARALPRILRTAPDARVLFAGQHEEVLGEAACRERLLRALRGIEDRWRFLGVVPMERMAAFFRSLDVIVVPSLNSTESFGLVQVEAMLCGTPSVASDLPGVRQPILTTGMGEIVPLGSSDALGDAILRIWSDKERYVKPRAEIAGRYGTERTIDAYESLFERLRA